jgi:hypothetical protein
MARKGYEKVSQREYARRLNISNEAVSKAVREGRIKKGWNKKEEKIIVEHADLEFGFLFKETTVNEPETEDTGQTNSKGKKLTDSSSFMEAKRIREIKLAQLAALDLEEREGRLVNKEQVFKELFVFGQNLRTSILAIPDRTIDNIMASESRAEAHNLLTEALQGALEELTKTDNLKFQTN